MDDFSVEPDEPGPAPVLRSIVEPPRVRPGFAVVFALLLVASTSLVLLLFYTAHQLTHFME